MASTGHHQTLWSIILTFFQQCANDNSKVIDTATLGLAGDVAESLNHKDHTQIQKNMYMTYLLDLTAEYDESESNNLMFKLW